jgi:hypothetical protein
MPRLHPAQGGQMSLLRTADQSDFGGEEAMPVVRGVGVQDSAAGGGATRSKEGPEDHGLRGLWEASVGQIPSAQYQIPGDFQ